MRILEQHVTQEVIRELLDAGWTHAGRATEIPMFVRQEAAEIVFQVSVDMTTHGDGLALFPSLGVQHVEMSRLARKFKGLPPSRGPGASTYGCALSDLLYQHGHPSAPFTRWLVRSSEDVQAKAAAVRSDIEEFGTPFLRSLSTLEAVVSRLETEDRSPPVLGQLSIAYALTGRYVEAAAALASYAAEAETQQPPMSTQSRKFLQSYTEHFGISERPPARSVDQ